MSDEKRLEVREEGTVERLTEALKLSDAEVTRLKAALATARDSLQHQSEAAAQGWERAATLTLEKVARAKAELERDALAEALEKIAGLVGPESEDVMYGSFHGGDPRDFSPDPECSTEAERSAHAVACKKAEEESGAARLLSDTHSFERLDEDAAVHIARAGFGLGTTVFRNEALCEAMDIIAAALLKEEP